MRKGTREEKMKKPLTKASLVSDTAFTTTQDSYVTSSSKNRPYNMSSTRLAVDLIALLLMSATRTGGPKSNTTRRRGMAFRDVGEVNGDLTAIAGAIGPSSFFS